MNPKPKLKPQARSREVRKLTIAAAFLCRDGLVLCADTEETRGEMKFQAPKLVVCPEGEESSKRKAVFAGAGDSAFIDKLVDEMWSAGRFALDGIESMFEAMEDACIRVHQRYWGIYPPDARPEAHIIFGIVEGGETRLYKATGPIVNRVAKYELTGSGDSLARYIASRAETGSSVKEAVGLSVYLLAETKKFVQGCGGASHIVVLNSDGTHWKVEEDRISSTTVTIGAIQNEMWSLLGSLTDHDLESDRFEAVLRGTAEFLRGVRRADERFFQTVRNVTAIATSALWNDSDGEEKLKELVDESSLVEGRVAQTHTPEQTD